MFRVFLLLLSFFATPAFGQAGDRDGTYERVLQNRKAFERVVHMRGDSYMRGHALGFFPDLATDEQKKHPQWGFRSPASTFNTMAPAGVVAAYAGATGQPDPGDTAPVAAELKKQARRGIIRNGDVVVLQDAGLTYGSPREFLKNWLLLRAAVGPGVTVIFVTTPDRIRVPRYGSMSSVLYQYDYPFAGLTHNDATRIAAERGKLVDLAALVDQAEKDGHNTMSDLIHINVEGQCILVDGVFRALDLKPTRPCRIAHSTVDAAPTR